MEPGQLSCTSWRPQLLFPSRTFYPNSPLPFLRLFFQHSVMSTNWGKVAITSTPFRTASGAVRTPPEGSASLFHTWVCLPGVSQNSPRGLSEPSPHMQAQSCCLLMASVEYPGMVARENKSMENARTWLSLLQVSWKYFMDSKGFRTWRQVPGCYGDHSEGCTLPDG